MPIHDNFAWTAQRQYVNQEGNEDWDESCDSHIAKNIIYISSMILINNYNEANLKCNQA